ncbi:MAG: TrmH family RNA methyltransferase [Candidatus Andersenbacteria bacterium]
MVTKKTTQDLVGERPTPETLSSMERTPISIIMDNVRSLDNVGLLFRLCETARLKKLYLTGYTGHPRIDNDERPKALIARHEHRIAKTAVYALPYQPWEYIEDPLPLTQQLKSEGNAIVSLEQTSGSVPYHHLDAKQYTLPLVIIVGHERQGVRQELLDLSDHVVEIPILGLGNSHNVALSTSIVLYHLLEKKGLL